MTQDQEIPPERPPSAITPELLEKCAEIAPTFRPIYVQVQPFAGALPGDSLANVVAYLARQGGQSQLGWRIVEREGIFLRGYFHACWASPQEELLDVTPGEPGQDRILFLPDLAVRWQGQPIESRFAPLSFKREVQELIALCRKEEHLRNQRIVDRTEYQNVLRGIDQVARKLARRM
jgi:hypothetical protein